MPVNSIGTPTLARVAQASTPQTVSLQGTWGTGQSRVAGRLLVAEVTCHALTSTTAITCSAGGFTQLGEGVGSARARAALFYKWAAGGDTAPTFQSTLTGTATYGVMEVLLWELTGADTTTPFPANYIGTNYGTTTLADLYTPGTITRDGCFAMAAWAHYLGTTARTMTWTPSGVFSHRAGDEGTSYRAHGLFDDGTPNIDYAAIESAPSSNRAPLVWAAIIGVVQAAFVPEQGTATLAGTGTLTAAGSEVQGPMQGAAALAGGEGSLTAAGVSPAQGTAALAGTGTLDAAGAGVTAGAAALAGQGDLSAAAGLPAAGSAALAGQGTLSAGGYVFVPGGGGPPALNSYAESAWSTGQNKSTTTQISFAPGDIVWLFAVCEGAVITWTPQAVTGLSSWSSQGFVGSGSQCGAQSWTATATGTGTVTVTVNSNNSSSNWGFACWVWRGSDGWGTKIGTASSTSPHTLYTASLARAYDNSRVCGGFGDYNAGNPASASWTPAGATSEEKTYISGRYAYGAADWPDQGSAGTSSYGVTSYTTSGPLTKIYQEVRGSAGGAGTYLGAAALAGQGSLSAAGAEVPPEEGPAQGTAALSGSGSLTAAGAGVGVGAASLSGSGSLAAAGVVAVPGAASLAGQGTLTAAGIGGVGAGLSGQGTLTAAGLVAVPGAAALAGGAGTLAAVGRAVWAGAAGLAGGSGALTAAGRVVWVGAAGLAGSGALTAAGIGVAQGAAGLAGGGGVLTAVAAGLVTATLTGGAGTLAGAAMVAWAGAAGLAGGAGVLTAVGISGIGAYLSGQGLLTAAGIVVYRPPAALAGGPGVLAAAAVVAARGLAALAGGAGILTASGGLGGAAILTGGSGVLAAAAKIAVPGAALLSGQGVLTGRVTLVASALLAGAGALTAAGRLLALAMFLEGLAAGPPHGRWQAGPPHGRYAAGVAHGRWQARAPHA